MDAASIIFTVGRNNARLNQLKTILNAENHTVVIENNPQPALQKIIQAIPNMVIIELFAPENEAFEYVKALAHNEHTKNIPVIFTGVKKSRQAIAKIFQLGASDYLSEPFVKEEIISRVKLHLQISKSKSATTPQLHPSTNQWETIFNSINDTILVIDSDFTIKKANKHTSPLFVNSRENITGRKCYQVVFGKQCKNEECPLFKVQKSKKREMHIKQVGNKWLNISIDPIFNHKQEMVGAIEVISDISQTMATEEKLQHSQYELLKVQEITHTGSWYLNLATNEVSWTEELYKMYGFDPTLPPPPYTEHRKLFTPESWQQLSASLEHTQKTGVPYELELEMIRTNRPNGWMWVRGEVVKNEEGKMVGLWGAAQDITERKKLERLLLEKNNEILSQNEEFQQLNEELDQTNRELSIAKTIAEENEIRYHTVVSNTPMVSFVLDANGVFTLSEGKGLERLGLKPGQVVGQSAFEVYKNYPILVEDLKKALKGQSFRSGTNVAGSTFDIFYTPIFDQQHRLIEVLGVANDITDRIAAEQEIQTHKKELEEFFENDISADFLISNDGFIRNCNRTFLKLFGFDSKNDAINFNVFNLFKDQNIIRLLISQIEENKKLENIELELTSLQGKALFAAINLQGIFNEKNQLTGLRGFAVDMTDRIAAERELMHSEERFRRAIEEAPFPIMIHADDEQVIALSRGWTTMSGYTLNDIPTTQEWSQKAYGEKQEEVKNYIDQLYQISHWVDEGEYPITTRNGEKRIWDFGSAPLGQLSDGRRLVVSMAKDITELKQSVESIQRLSTAIDQSPLTILITNKKGVIEYVNPFFTKITGYRYNEAIGQNPRMLQSGETSAETYHQLWKTLSAGKTWKGEFKNRKKNGEFYWESASISPITNQNGETVSYLAIKEDITQHKELLNQVLKAKEEAEKNEKLFSTLFSSMQGGFYLHELVYDKDHKPVNYKILQANEASEKHLGIKPSEAIGKLATELYNLPEAPFLDRYSRVAEKGIPITLEEFFEPMNKYFHISVFSPQKGMFATVFSDITYKKIENEELIMAKKRAEESDRLKSAFLANMSHEIRTPLNGILGFTELIVDPSFDQKEKENMAHIILENGDLLMTIINDVLDISKIEAGQLELRYSQFKTGKLIREVSTMFLAKTNKNKLNLVLNVSEETYEIVLNSDFIRLKQVLSNLVSNAMKYTDKGTVEIGAFKEENSLIIYVKDTGRGIENEMLEKIFERFNRSDAYTKKVGGTGLGLAISKNLVEMLGGRIWVESKLKKGSCFYVSLPVGL